MRIDPNNVYAMPVVAGDYATTSVGDKGVSQNYAENIVLIAAVQTRHNNRFVISGSLDFFSDSYYAENADNQVLSDQLSLCSDASSLTCRAVQVLGLSASAEHRALQVHPRGGSGRSQPRDPGAGSAEAEPADITVEARWSDDG